MTWCGATGLRTRPVKSGSARADDGVFWGVLFCLALLLAGPAGAVTPMESSAPVWTTLPALPDPEGFASAFAGTSHDSLLVAGGANFPGKRPWEGGTKVWYDRVFVLEAPDATWKDAGRLPMPNAYGVSCSVAQGVVCVGGGDAKEHFRDVFLLAWDGQRLTTTPLPPLPVPLAFGSGVAIGEAVYIFGGLIRPDATGAESALYRLDLTVKTPRWETLPPCPGAGRMLAQMGTVGGEIIVCGGVALHAGADGKAVRTYLADAYAFSGARGWRRIADLPRAIAAAPSPMPLTATGELMVVSGDDGTRGHLVGPNHPGFPQQVLLYHPGRNEWRAVAEAPFSRATAPAAIWRGAWVIASGERRPGYRSNEMWSVRTQP